MWKIREISLQSELKLMTIRMIDEACGSVVSDFGYHADCHKFDF